MSASFCRARSGATTRHIDATGTVVPYGYSGASPTAGKASRALQVGNEPRA